MPPGCQRWLLCSCRVLSSSSGQCAHTRWLVWTGAYLRTHICVYVCTYVCIVCHSVSKPLEICSFTCPLCIPAVNGIVARTACVCVTVPFHSFPSLLSPLHPLPCPSSTPLPSCRFMNVFMKVIQKLHKEHIANPGGSQDAACKGIPRN